MKSIYAAILIAVVLSTVSPVTAVEKLDRGLTALQRPDGAVFLSWRLLESDGKNIAFDILRAKAGADDAVTLTADKIHRLTCFLDKTTGKSGNYTYELRRHLWRKSNRKPEALAKATISLTADPKPYISIPLDGGYDFQKVGVGDLDGDGALELLIKQPNFNTDPYQKPGYWKKSNTTYKIEAYSLADKKMLWRHDMGWSIEAGIWYSPWIIYDVDGDGRAEVYCKAGQGDPRDKKGLVQTGPEWLIKLDGRTGKEVARAEWPSREGFGQYNYYCRNFLTVAHLDGKTPSLIIQRGTYNLIKMQALDKNLKQIWYWDTTQEDKKYGGQSGHGLITADIDADGRDELVMGSAVIDDNGKGLWTQQMGHPDVFYVADITDNNPGLEIFYALETRQKADGLMVVDAKTGRKLWTHKEPTFHLHGQGMAADILAEYPGVECFGGERDFDKRWLYSADGKLIKFYENKMTLTPRPLWWDADAQKEVVIGSSIMNWDGDTIQPIEGRPIAVMDCLGDYREELITTLKGELRIYTTTIPAKDRRVCLLQDRQYRLGVLAQTMGYYYPATLGIQQQGVSAPAEAMAR